MPGGVSSAVGRAGLPGQPRGGTGAGAELAPHLLELLAGGHLLGEERGLDPVEQALEPADELGLGDAQLGLAGAASSSNGMGEPGQLLAEVGRQRSASSATDVS